MKIVGAAYGEEVYGSVLAFLFVEKSVKSLEFGEECCPGEVSIQDANAVRRVHCRYQLTTRIKNGRKVAGGYVACSAYKGKGFIQCNLL